jgi:hypothetical protein
VEALIKDDEVILEEWRRATTAPKHLHGDGDVITIKPRRGTDRAYLLGRERAGVLKDGAGFV